ncbi:MAG: 30S ribosomal protein S16 [Chloroflexaceae bacterium]|nr:30S ribosomal protein S16 [Chloroflexaceae bacterium]
MVRIRLRRTGKTRQPHYRVVIADSRAPRDGRFIEIIGHYSPVRQPKVLEIKADRARYWLGVGAKPSDTVFYLLKKVQILDDEGNIIPADETTEAVAEPVPQVVLAPAALDSDNDEAVEDPPYEDEYDDSVVTVDDTVSDDVDESEMTADALDESEPVEIQR